MSDPQKPHEQARFWGQDPRFAVVGDEHYPVLLMEYLTGENYSEDLTQFDGYREQFFALAQRRSTALLVEEKGEEWEMKSFHKISNVEMTGKMFRCTVGPELTSLPDD